MLRNQYILIKLLDKINSLTILILDRTRKFYIIKLLGNMDGWREGIKVDGTKIYFHELKGK